MKTLIKILSIITLAYVLSSCKKDDAILPEDNKEKTIDSVETITSKILYQTCYRTGSTNSASVTTSIYQYIDSTYDQTYQKTIQLKDSLTQKEEYIVENDFYIKTQFRTSAIDYTDTVFVNYILDNDTILSYYQTRNLYNITKTSEVIKFE